MCQRSDEECQHIVGQEMTRGRRVTKSVVSELERGEKEQKTNPRKCDSFTRVSLETHSSSSILLLWRACVCVCVCVAADVHDRESVYEIMEWIRMIIILDTE